jgi:predicted enzyme related to lactoylglutathione lyase
MALRLAKDSIDIGIVITDSDASLRFYRDTLGLEHVADMAMGAGGDVMRRLVCGTTLVKLLKYETPPTARNPPGGSAGAVGIRYFTMFVLDIETVVRRFEEAGDHFSMPLTQVRPGLRVAKVDDPDGNCLELVERS